ncbi:VPLPA-CTERM protein sorting domain-containing protein [Paucidesulfovibrio gracilis DSM 16080]|uniref:VPLPA-CTERM protein sorting domain-containing protein n=1 Tax=Paucidesulfovibrio gracilis DSM 16080 TaxID=1121449 RepID=A0A1T4XLP5_9BACT|nr:VPLPA-CTERM sorting domain-containing protein [Paucidesulfovibrio gracilis]SKA90426.1 VPLPA-CTERM protein sorting domain-containing protein [Paucidesulfovibrio gracilis DSM 16080]
MTRNIFTNFIMALAVVLFAGSAMAAVMPVGFSSYSPVGVSDALRIDPNNALVYDPAGDDQSGNYNFTSLGFGGSIVLNFANPIINGAGADLQVFETSWGGGTDNWAAYPETAEVWAFQGNYSGQAYGDPGWVRLGYAQQDGSFDFDGLITGTSAILVRDVSRDFGFTGSGDGFDLDGVVANYATPLPAGIWLLGGGLIGLIGLRHRRRG